MSIKNSIDCLPDELKAALLKLLNKPQTTIDQATEFINGLLSNKKISRSAIGRYKKHIDATGKKLQQTRIIAQAVAQEYGQDSTNSVGRLLLEKIRTLVFDVMDLLDAEDLSPAKRLKNIKGIAQTLHHIELAASSSLEGEKKIRKMMAEETVRSLKKSGLDKDSLKTSIIAVRNTYGLTT